MIKVPPILKKGDKVAIVAPAGKVKKDALEKGISILKSWGLEPIIGKYLYDDCGYFSSNDENRLADLQWALDDSNIKAIFCARGGYGTSRIIENLNFNNFVKNPKWVVGYSDITILLNKIQTYNIACIHGPMPASFYKYNNSTLKLLQNFLFSGKIKYTLHQKNGYFFENKTLYSFIPTGGNLTLLSHSVGTNYQVNTSEKILILEEVNEDPYKIERYLFQLYHAGVLNSLKGLIFGKIQTKKQKDFTLQLKNIEFIHSFAPNIEFFIHNFPCGHGKLNYPIAMNIPLKFQIKSNKLVFFQEFS